MLRTTVNLSFLISIFLTASPVFAEIIEDFEDYTVDANLASLGWTYYSATQSKLVYKDSGSSVNDLY